MKVTILNKSDIKGGAAKAAYRLHTRLNKIGLDSSMLVDAKFSDEEKIHGLISSSEKIKEKIRKSLTHCL